MIETAKIEINKVKTSKITEVDFDNLPFGRVFTDHMFMMEYKDGKWEQPRIEPFRDLNLHPATSAIHYGQSIFEGMKAYKNKGGDVMLFRPEQNAQRMNKSADRMCMPNVPEDLFINSIKELVALDKNWIPEGDDSSLYIRPFMFATDDYIGIKPSDNYVFCVFCCPVGAYYGEPIKVKIETTYTRAADGGVGEAKAAGNYAASLYPAKLAKEQGYHQLIWTDAKEHKYIEEAGTMNVIFEIDGKLVTPKTEGTILPGITRKSVLEVAKSWGITVEERPVLVTELRKACDTGMLSDAFGAGTAATIAQIATIGFEDENFELPAPKSRGFSNKVYDYLNDLKRGNVEDPYGWIVKV